MTKPSTAQPTSDTLPVTPQPSTSTTSPQPGTVKPSPIGPRNQPEGTTPVPPQPS
jgi:hypothetical protein